MNTFVSLFSGAGLMDLGFELAGWECVAAVEIDKSAVATWKHNRPGKEDRILCEDIRKVDAERLSITLGTLGLIIGGPPCQGFSVANGARVHKNGNTSAWKDDPKNLLYKEFLRLVKALRPERFVMENVKAMYTTGADEPGQPGPIMREVLTDFTEAGYLVAAQVLDASDYGVPQFRERVIVVGVRTDLPYPILYPIQSHGAPGSGFTPWRTVRDAIGGLPEPGETIPNHEGNPLASDFFERTAPKWEKRWGGMPVVDPEKPGATVDTKAGRASGYSQPILMTHPEPRRLTPRECARLQSVPDWYFFCGSKSAAYRQIGNGVPVELARRIGAVLIGTDKGREKKPHQPQLTLF